MLEYNQADFLERLAREVADLRADLDAQKLRLLEAQIVPGSIVPSLGDGSPPSPPTTGTGSYSNTTLLGNGVVTTATIADGAITAGKILAGAVDMTKFASGIVPPRVVPTLPTLPDSNFPEDCYAFLTSDKTLYRNVAGTWTAASDADLTTNMLYAGAISAGAISADELAATIILASLIKTADTGYRVEIDSDGVRCIDGDGYLMVKIPTDGSPVYVYGQLQATSLNVLGNQTLAGSANEVSEGAALILMAGLGNPTSAPLLTQTWDAYRLTGGTPGCGLEYTSAGGAGKSTKVFYVVGNGYRTVYEFLASDGSLNRSVTLPSTYEIVNTAVLGSYLYVSARDLPSSKYRVLRYAITDLSWDTTYGSVDYPYDDDAGGAAICSDGTYLYIVQVNASHYVVWNRYTSVLVKSGSTVTSSYNTGSTDMWDACAGSADLGAWRMVVTSYSMSSATAHVYDSTGARQANECFPVPSKQGVGLTYGDALGDGARFWSWGWNWGLHYGYIDLAKHSTWNWTTESSVYWVAYSWYDSVATTHETQCGPRASITMGRRKRLDVACAPIPGGEVDNHRLYMERGATDPGLTNLKLQATFATDGTSLSTFASGGAADPGSNDFGAGTPAEIKSSTTGWSLKGDGTAEFADHPRFVPVTGESIISGADGQTSDQTVTPTTLPTDGSVKAVAVVFGIRRNADTDNESIAVKHYGGATAAVAYTSGVASRGGFSTWHYVETGGTDNVQFKWASSDAGSDNDCYITVYGYWSTE